MNPLDYFISYAEVIPPEPFVPDVYQQLILDDLSKIIFTCTLISILLFLQLFFGFIKPGGKQNDDDLF